MQSTRTARIFSRCSRSRKPSTICSAPTSYRIQQWRWLTASKSDQEDDQEFINAFKSQSRGLPRKSLWASKEVYLALATKRPVVALESTIYTHGFPYPDNVALALDLEEIVRKNGAVPATIGILDGRARVGMSKEEIETLASSAGLPETMKVSRRDLPYILGMGLTGKRLNGGTTISGTMLLARRAGIEVFGTGGLGGVHRGGEDSMDISADLTELGRTPVAVISSGCKSFLDIPRTLEYLETQGATVCTFADGRTGDIDFPAFFTRESGVKSPLVIQTPAEAAAMIYFGVGAKERSGMLFANPIPEAFAMDKAEIDQAIDQAVREAAEQGFHGHSNTPFILARIKDLTKGNSIPANRALIESNVAMAAKIAVELSKLKRRFRNNRGKPSFWESLQSSTVNGERKRPSKEGNTEKMTSRKVTVDAEADIIVIGSVAIDLSCDYSPKTDSKSSQDSTAISPQMHTSNIANITPSIGGVGHNVALAAQRAGKSVSVSLRSFVADDMAGAAVLSALESEGLSTSEIHHLPVSTPRTDLVNHTAQYVAINDQKKDLVLAMADMSIFTNNTPTLPSPSPPPSSSTKQTNPWIVLDANWSPTSIRSLLTSLSPSPSLTHPTKIIFEPVSVPKSTSLFPPPTSSTPSIQVFPNHSIHLSTPNQYELSSMHAAAKSNTYFETSEWWSVIDSLGIPSSGARDRFLAITNKELTDAGIPQMSIQLLPYIPILLTKLGAQGILLTELLKPGDGRLRDPSHAKWVLSRCMNGSESVGGVYMRLYPASEEVKEEDVVSVNGVGDTFLGVLVAGLGLGCSVDGRLIGLAQRGAVMTLRCKESVSPELGILGRELEGLAEMQRLEAGGTI